MDNLSAKLFEDTPTITVNDNLGRPVRVVEFNRTNIGDERSVRISRTEFSATGYTSGSSDPRFFLRGLTNQKQQWNLAGQLVRVDSVDAGERLILPDVTGAAYLEWDEKGKRRRYEYDTALHRLVAVHEKVSQDDVSEQVLERWVYGQQEDALFNLNLQVKAHYDLGGCLETQAFSLTGQPLSQRRRLLWDYSAQSDWQGESTNEWNKRLGVQEYHTVWAYNALGQWLTQQDAKDNIQRQEYDCTGRLSASYYQVVGSEETPTLALIEYNANGQVILEKAGNGVETHYQYDKKDWRLIKVTTTRPVKEGRVALLQSLNYSYDRVGNLLSVKDDAQAPRFYKNQRVGAEQAYSYDALYQIIKAVGREKAGNNIQGASLPELLTPLSDSHQLQNYTRYYDYDASGNMLSIQHKGSHDYRRDFVVATHSNQSVAQNPNNTLTPEGIRHRFDTHGNLTQLEGGEALVWGRYDLLRETILSSKQKETYQYSQRGARLRKVLIDENNATKEEVIYLPGLEIRERSDIRNGAVKERLNVVLISGSRGQVRELQWEIGLPSGVTNHQLRYNFSNHIGSHSLELNNHADILSQEEYYPFGGTAIWSAKSDVEAKYKFVRYSGKERDITGLYYYGYRYYMPWMCRWLSPDPAWDIDGLNLYRMVRNNPANLFDNNGLSPSTPPLGTYEMELKTVDRFKFSIGSYKYQPSNFDEKRGKYIRSNEYALAMVGDKDLNGYLFEHDELISNLRDYFSKFNKINNLEIDEERYKKNIKLGCNISGFLLHSANTFLEDDHKTSSFLEDDHKANTELAEQKFFAVVKKSDKNKMGYRKVYALGEAYVENKFLEKTKNIYIKTLVAHPYTQVNSNIRSQINDYDKEYDVKGVGSFTTIEATNKLIGSVGYFSKYKVKIFTEAENVRSAAIAIKYGAKHVSGFTR
ncbi:RHS repeat domain-containing protein [Vibrio hyugaensis]|uniref:RHS repeat domain-containing protein n=1 Tax=Vibrio hyugaensis TaxID=1534743 RepID=UPI000CE347CA|nr:RHS repeat-associated core domain-containing protein [Vibrio hyugaensis]